MFTLMYFCVLCVCVVQCSATAAAYPSPLQSNGMHGVCDRYGMNAHVPVLSAINANEVWVLASSFAVLLAVCLVKVLCLALLKEL